METASPLADDPVAVLRRLTADQIRNRIESLDGERRALQTLLRAAITRERHERREGGPSCRLNSELLTPSMSGIDLAVATLTKVLANLLPQTQALLRPEAAARYLGVSRSYFDQLAAGGRIPRPVRLAGPGGLKLYARENTIGLNHHQERVWFEEVFLIYPRKDQKERAWSVWLKTKASVDTPIASVYTSIKEV